MPVSALLRYVVSPCLSEIGNPACLCPIEFLVQEEVELRERSMLGLEGGRGDVL